MPVTPTIALCRCGEVTLALAGEPIVRASCHCTSCRTAGLAFEAAGAPRMVDADGGTDYVLYRKDRIAVASGAARLVEHRLTPASPTRRMVAGCCNTPMLLDFTKGHWVSILRDRLPADIRPLDLRVMTADRIATTPLPDDVPNHAGFGGLAIAWRLLSSRVAMGWWTPPAPW